MRFGVTLPNFGDLASPTTVVELAVKAERAGWDGFFVWDHIVVADGMPVADPWVQLSAVATVTERMRIGPLVTPLPRRRPWVLARQSVTLDRLSQGRLTLGVGLGFPPDEEFGTFGEPTDDRHRAELLDEGLDVLEGMWSGEPFEYAGDHYRVRRTSFAPSPVQRPRIPIWVAATWPRARPMRRAARFEGVVPLAGDMSTVSPDDTARISEVVRSDRTDDRDFDVVVIADVAAGAPDAYREAGASWYVVSPEMGSTVERIAQWIDDGPPG